ncbi:membrane-bound lytic murein transglycosylase MltF [Halomonas sp. HNIBRBA4712]|uniref:membrane-bound lytic murein transglycosylase MltF n=1 Tax=Halomonas sp. HNIBRBA4712 TaxID=3373087 RepID=UPI003745F821
MPTLDCRHFLAYYRLYWAVVSVVWLCLVPTVNGKMPAQHLERVLEKDFITAHTRTTPTTYYEGRQGPTGFEYELLHRFAESLGVSLNLNGRHAPEEVLDAVRSQGDIGAAALALDPSTPGIHYTRPIIDMQPLLVYRRGLYNIDTTQNLTGLRIATLRDTGTEQALSGLQDKVPGLDWQALANTEIAELLARVESGEFDAAVIFDHQFRVNRLFFPNVERGFSIGEPRSLAWALPAGQGLELLEAANRFLDAQRESGELARLVRRYFGHDDYLEYVGTRTFLGHLDKRLPEFAPLFKQAAHETGFDWKLLAAVGYQESHWDPEAVSPTGVRGLMMLTHPTASDMGVQNRRDPAQSIDGGARYLRNLEERLPEEIVGDNRLYMALAAYNVGLGHLYDARDIARMRGGDPNLWADVREALPLLQQRRWHSQTRYGFARGGEPVIYVRNIRRYYEMLSYVERSRQQFFQLGQTGLASAETPP